MTRRVLFFVTDLEIGGTPTVVRELATRLHDPTGGWQMDVACLSRWGPVADEIASRGLHVTALEARSPADLPRSVARLSHLLHARQTDTLLSFLLHANVIATLATRCGTTVRLLQSIQTTQPRPAWHWPLQRLVSQAADKILVPSPSVADIAHHRCHVPHARIVILPNAIDPADFATITPLADSASPRVIGFIGRLDPVKRIPDLVAALSHLPANVHLHIWGAGPDLPNVLSAIDRFQVRHRTLLHGRVPRPQDALSRMHLLALPSAAEGFGLVLIEAMAARIPIVATNVPGIRDVVTDTQTGLLVPPAAPIALAAAIARVLADTSLRDRLTTAALADVHRRFSWNRVLDRYRAVL